MNDFFGRLLSVIFSAFTVYGIYVLVRKVIDDQTALWSAFIYSILPLNIYFGRVFMPEPAMLMCSVYGIYFFVKWIEGNRNKDFFISALFITLAALLKLPALYLGLPLAYLSYKKFGASFIKNRMIWLFVLIVFIPVIAWYYHAHLLYFRTGLTFGIWNAGTEKWGMIEPLLTLKFYNDIFFKSIAERHLTYGAFIVFIWGLFIKREHKLERLFDFWLIGMLIFIFLAPQAHSGQEYYQLPFSIAASVFIAKVFSRYLTFSNLKNTFSKNKTAVSFLLLCLVSIFILSFLRIQNFMKSENFSSPIFKLSEAVNESSSSTDKFITITNGDPTMLYIIGRKGWTTSPDGINSENIREKINRGALYVAGEKSVLKTGVQKDSLEKLKNENEVIVNNDQFFIIKLKQN